MSDYTPDTWAMLKFTHEGKTFYKVLAGWGGSYLYGASWKLNSGVTKVETDGDYYLFSGYSGSVYQCHKNGYGLSGYTAGILQNFQDQVKDTETTIELMPEETDWSTLDFSD
jgi:hypothetical protein